ncbi:hypothetical protein AK812_SmicGene19396 [Symbiodinium microadriaticum]|uniref:Uncharacterized protein n=1 Tax=Symbiodinium microadriaticum TaxID=2951 RepID=A0A1Q9DSP3_SYMMI|nr:hypothetical protein AK812_SmicGene19396 [Symbiodinium microadriaticum]
MPSGQLWRRGRPQGKPKQPPCCVSERHTEQPASRHRYAAGWVQRWSGMLAACVARDAPELHEVLVEMRGDRAPESGKGKGAAEAPARRRPLIEERVVAPSEDRGRAAQRANSPGKGKGKEAPSAGRPASASRTPSNPAKGKKGKLSKGKPAPLQPKSRRAQNPDAPPEPKTPAEEASADESEEPKNASSESSLEVHPAPFFTGPVPGENPDFGREHAEAERDQPPASSKAAPAAKEETAEREEPPASKSAAPKAAEEAEAKPKTSAKAAARATEEAEAKPKSSAEAAPKVKKEEAQSSDAGRPAEQRNKRRKQQEPDRAEAAETPAPREEESEADVDRYALEYSSARALADEVSVESQRGRRRKDCWFNATGKSKEAKSHVTQVADETATKRTRVHKKLARLLAGIDADILSISKAVEAGGSQYILPYEQAVPPGSRNKVAAVAAKRGHYDDIPDHGLEARWVEDAAAAQPDSEEEAGEERKNRDTLEDQAEDPAVPLLTMDYRFDGKEVPEESAFATVLNLADGSTGLVGQFLDRLGYDQGSVEGRNAPFGSPAVCDAEFLRSTVGPAIRTSSAQRAQRDDGIGSSCHRFKKELVRREPPGEPSLFEDGPRPDDEALLMVARPQQASRLPHASLIELANADLSADYAPSDAETQLAAASAPPPALASTEGPGPVHGREEAQMNVFVPMPTPESDALLELAALNSEGWVTRDELEEALTCKLSQEYDFQRGTKVPGAILTLPDSKHAENICEQLGISPREKGTVPSKPLDLTKVEELSAGHAATFRSAVGSAIYLSADRRDVQFALKEMARKCRRHGPATGKLRKLARWLRAKPRIGPATVRDQTARDTGRFDLEMFSDSDWAGCPETREGHGTANFATKHPTSGPEVRAAPPSAGMVNLDSVQGAEEALAHKGAIKNIQGGILKETPWKMTPPVFVVSTALRATIVAQQVRPAKAQGPNLTEAILGFAVLGFPDFLWMLSVVWVWRRRAVAIATAQPAPREPFQAEEDVEAENGPQSRPRNKLQRHAGWTPNGDDRLEVLGREHLRVFLLYQPRALVDVSRSGSRLAVCVSLWSGARRLGRSVDPAARAPRVSEGHLRREAFGQWQLDNRRRQAVLLERIPALGDLQPAWLLLFCTSTCADYLLRMLLPPCTAECSREHDLAVASCLATLLYREEAPELQADALATARTPLGGLRRTCRLLGLVTGCLPCVAPLAAAATAAPTGANHLTFRDVSDNTVWMKVDCRGLLWQACADTQDPAKTVWCCAEESQVKSG